VFVPAKVREVYLAALLEGMGAQHSVRSAIVFCATCRHVLLLPVPPFLAYTVVYCRRKR
jgi:hypothetical protein